MRKKARGSPAPVFLLIWFAVMAVALSPMLIKPPPSFDLTRARLETVRINVGSPTSHEGASGVYLGNGLVLTARHVAVYDDPSTPSSGTSTRNTLYVTTHDGKPHAAEIAFVSDDLDFAILKVSGLQIPAASLACREPVLDEPVTIIGNPLLIISDAVSHGTVTSDVPVTFEDLLEVGLTPLRAVIIPGNSGGPVFDASGHVLGIAVVAIADGVYGAMVSSHNICNEIPRV